MPNPFDIDDVFIPQHKPRKQTGRKTGVPEGGGVCAKGKKLVRINKGKRAGSTYCTSKRRYGKVRGGHTVKSLRTALAAAGHKKSSKSGTSIWKAKKSLLLRMYRRRIEGMPPLVNVRPGVGRANQIIGPE